MDKFPKMDLDRGREQAHQALDSFFDDYDRRFREDIAVNIYNYYASDDQGVIGQFPPDNLQKILAMIAPEYDWKPE